MPLPVASVGHKFRGHCLICDAEVEGVMISGAEERCVEGRPICVTGSKGRGDCGHSCEAIGQSEVWRIHGLPVARVGDPVTGEIIGEIIEGWDFVFCD